MSTERLDPRATEKLNGPAWDALRHEFEDISTKLLNVNDTAMGELTTIYIKYFSPETAGKPYGVVWVKNAARLIVGLSLPDAVCHERLVGPPKGCNYSGLTKFVVVDKDNGVPPEFEMWAKAAHAARSNE